MPFALSFLGEFANLALAQADLFQKLNRLITKEGQLSNAKIFSINIHFSPGLAWGNDC
jgi:hypothetical protein